MPWREPAAIRRVDGGHIEYIRRDDLRRLDRSLQDLPEAERREPEQVEQVRRREAERSLRATQAAERRAYRSERYSDQALRSRFCGSHGAGAPGAPVGTPAR